jgi:ligand-binding sensor domain-containing protein
MSRRLIDRVLALILTLSAPAYASNARIPLSDYVITSWTMKDGLPSAVIWAIAQDRDGYLWLGTNGGLVRFDGVQFIAWDKVGGSALPDAPVRSLAVAHDGAMWVGFSLSESAGVSRVAGGILRSYGKKDGLAVGTVNALVEDRDGVMWAGTNTGLFRLRSDRWQLVGASNGLPPGRVDSLYVDSSGNLLVGTDAGVFRKPAGEALLQLVDASDTVAPLFRAFSEDRSHRIWMTDPVRGFRVLGDHAAPAGERARGNKLLHDHDGELWVTTTGSGIWRIASNGRAATIEKAYAPGARAIFEDRDGQIWASNGEGLVRFAKPKVKPITDVGLILGVQADPDGGIWATTPDGVTHFGSGSGPTPSLEELRQPGIRTFRTDERGVLWIAARNTLLRVSGGVRTYPLPVAAGLDRINDIASDLHGGLWISDLDRGLFTFNPSTPKALEPVRALLGVRISSMLTDSAGRLWFATTMGSVGVMEAGAVHMYGAESGLGEGLIFSLYEDSRRVLWVGANDGLKRFTDGRFVHVNQDGRFRTVGGIVEDRDGDLWLGTTAGIVFINRAELEKAKTPGYPIYARVFDAADGIAGPPGFQNPSQVQDRNGWLWFVTGRGLTTFDPRQLKARGMPLLPRVERVFIDEKAIPATERVGVPAGATRLAIDYSILDLTTPPWRTQFRYRLDGFDSDWIEAGSHREAVYTRLPPGAYTFHVAASQLDGSWSATSESWAFDVAPRFYQTYWFYSVGITALCAVMGIAWQLRLRRVRRQFAVLIGERARLSREIHDTLLQGLVGVALQFDALGAKLEPASHERQQLVRIRKEVERYIREARHSIWNLRAPVIAPRNLPMEIRDTAHRITDGHAIDFDFIAIGTPYPCSADADEQLLRICQEAVLNAVRHAEATAIRVELQYDPDAVVLRVIDNGRGFDPETTVPMEAAGHYGLVSMRERASQVGGAFTVRTTEHAGTLVEARLPANA